MSEIGENWPDWAEPFLNAYREHLTLAAAAEAVHIDRVTAWRLKKRDPDFAEALEAIEEETTEAMEREAYRRGVEGVEQPVYQGGAEVGRVRKFSDTLLIFMLKARRPDVYRERVSVEDEREARERKALEAEDEAALDRRLTGFDKVTSIEEKRRAS